MSNFGDVRVYLFVSMLVAIVYIVLSSSTKSTTLASTDVVPKNLSKWNRTPKGSSNFQQCESLSFVSTLVTSMYIVVSYLTKSMTLASIDIGFQKSFEIELNVERLVKFSVM